MIFAFADGAFINFDLDDCDGLVLHLGSFPQSRTVDGIGKIDAIQTLFKPLTQNAWNILNSCGVK